MVKITNNTREVMDFNVPGNPKDGVPHTESLAPGETRDVDVDTESAQFRGRVLAGAITVPSRQAAKVETAAASPPHARTK